MEQTEQTGLIIVRGAGDLATGVIQKLVRAGRRVLCLEVPQPTAIRRSVALCEAVYEGTKQVEELCCRLISRYDEMEPCFGRDEVPLIIDPNGESITHLRPHAVVDAILAKRNLGTSMDMAPITIAMGPGFEAGTDVHAVVETMRGHDLARVYLQGCAAPNTGTPGEIGGKSADRVIHAPEAGYIRPVKHLGDLVHQGEPILMVNTTFSYAPFQGLLRGMIREGLYVSKGMKVADIDPRLDTNWHTISDKARAIGGGVLEALLYLENQAKRSAHKGTQP